MESDSGEYGKEIGGLNRREVESLLSKAPFLIYPLTFYLYSLFLLMWLIGLRSSSGISYGAGLVMNLKFIWLMGFCLLSYLFGWIRD